MFLETSVITINVAPCSKPRMTKRDRWAKRPSVLKFFAFRDAIKQSKYWKPHNLLSLESFDIEFYVEMPKSWSKKKKALHINQPHKQRPDLDNYIKAWCDSVFEEDSVVWRFKASKRWTDQKGHIKLSTL
jgi:Holliday junction resolvase RusA-like endonuclease